MPPSVSRKSLGGAGKPSSKASSVATDSARARKQTAPVSRTARKTNTARESTEGAEDEEEADENEDQLRSSAKKAPTSRSRKSPTTASTSSVEDEDEEDEATEEEVDVQSTLLGTRTKSGKDNAPAKKRPAAAKADKKPAAKAAKSTKKASVARNQKDKSKSTTGTTEDSDEEGSNVRTVRSTSARGYTWDVEAIEIAPEDLEDILIDHDVIKTTLERDGVATKVKFKPGDKIFVLPDPAYLPPVTKEIDIADLSDDFWWVAEIVGCHSIPQGEDQNDLGVLKVAWYYSTDDVKRIKPLKDSVYWKKLLKYRFEDDEFIASDHHDFIGIDSFAGTAEGTFSYLSIHGLKVSDVERMKAPHLRKLAKTAKGPAKGIGMTGWTMKKADDNARGKAVSGDADDEDMDVDESQSKKKPASKKAAKKVPSKKPASTASAGSAAAKKKKSSTSSKKAPSSAASATKKTSKRA